MRGFFTRDGGDVVGCQADDMSDVSPLISHVTDSVVGHENLVSDVQHIYIDIFEPFYSLRIELLVRKCQ